MEIIDRDAIRITHGDLEQAHKAKGKMRGGRRGGVPFVQAGETVLAIVIPL